MKDEIFKQKVQKQFEFDEKVASVFDDMISRSVPFYKENLRLIVALVAKLGAQNASICDLGCSTASLLLEFWRQNAAYKLRRDDRKRTQQMRRLWSENRFF